METLRKESILSADDSNCESVAVPEWSGTVHLRTMTGSERDDFEAAILAANGSMANIRAKLLVKCICDESGQRLFGDSDAAALGAKNAAVLDRLFTVAQKLNAIGANGVEELAKNSGSGPSAAPGSA